MPLEKEEEISEKTKMIQVEKKLPRINAEAICSLLFLNVCLKK